MEIKADSLQAKMIANALRSEIDLFNNGARGDEDWTKSIEEQYGMPLDFIVYCMEGLIGEINGSAVNLVQGGLRQLIQCEVSGAVKEAIAAAVIASGSDKPESLERTSVTEVAQRTTTVERSIPRAIAGGQTDKATLLQILESGRKLTPEQRKLLGMKKCSRCKKIKEFASFYESNYADGRFAWCIECDAVRAQCEAAAPAAPAELDERTYKELILAVLGEAGRAMRVAEIQSVIAAKWSRADMSPSTIGGELRKLMFDEKVEQLDRGLYISMRSAASRNDNLSTDLIKCNQCVGRFTLRDLPEHKRTEHPVS